MYPLFILQLFASVFAVGMTANVALHSTFGDRAIAAAISQQSGQAELEGHDSADPNHRLSLDSHPHHEQKDVSESLAQIGSDQPRASHRSTKRVYVAAIRPNVRTADPLHSIVFRND